MKIHTILRIISAVKDTTVFSVCNFYSFNSKQICIRLITFHFNKVGKLKSMWCFNLKYNVEWIYLATERAQWQILVWAVLNKLSVFYILN